MIKKSILFFISLYQAIVSPFFQKRCRFYPTCSVYTYQSVARYGALKGLFRGVKRILKCHPFNRGGVDLP